MWNTVLIVFTYLKSDAIAVRGLIFVGYLSLAHSCAKIKKRHHNIHSARKNEKNIKKKNRSKKIVNGKEYLIFLVKHF